MVLVPPKGEDGKVLRTDVGEEANIDEEAEEAAFVDNTVKVASVMDG